MKKKRTSIYIILLLSSLILFSTSTFAQERQIRFKKDVEQEEAETKRKEKTEKQNVAFYQGTTVGVEVFGLVNNLLGSDFLSAEVTARINLKNRYMPVIEIGYGQTDMTNDETDIHYKTSAPYFRIGMDYNMMYKKSYLPGYITVGGRVGHSSFSFDVDAPALEDPNWTGLKIPFSYQGIQTDVTWFELVVGVNTRIYKGLHMGWSLRYRNRLSMKEFENAEPYYVPGFGKNGKSNFGFTYNITYDLPF